MSSELTGSHLPPLTGANDSGDSTKRVEDLIERVRTQHPDVAKRIDERAAAIDNVITAKRDRLADLRRAVGLTQQQLAAQLGVSQPEVSKLEARETFMVDTLARFVAATGGHLRLLAEYDDGAVVELALTDSAEATEADA
ncbi:MAG: XRE family transcriptional regulator [Actinomycetota bacterium]|nr:XRE family transcriptional regulator [Actinomycetota bacterium]